jgi:hypothetical protein
MFAESLAAIHMTYHSVVTLECRDSIRRRYEKHKAASVVWNPEIVDTQISGNEKVVVDTESHYW